MACPVAAGSGRAGRRAWAGTVPACPGLRLSSWVYLGSLRPRTGLPGPAHIAAWCGVARAGCVRARGRSLIRPAIPGWATPRLPDPSPTAYGEPGHRPSQKVSTHRGQQARARADRIGASDSGPGHLARGAPISRLWRWPGSGTRGREPVPASRVRPGIGGRLRLYRRGHERYPAVRRAGDQGSVRGGIRVADRGRRGRVPHRGPVAGAG